MKHLHGITVLVLGLGDSGLAMARWCARSGARVLAWDSRDNPPHAATLAEQLPAVQRLAGELDAGALDGVRLVLKSPGLAPADARIAPLLAQARQTGVPVQGELDLFAAALADLKAERGYAPKVVAITGTNGKTTTTSMTAQLIERTGLRVAMAGNIGPTMLDTLMAALDLEPLAEFEPAAAEEGAAVAADAEAPLEAGQPEDDAPAIDLESATADAVEAVAQAPADAPAGDAPVTDAESAAEVGGGGPPPHPLTPPPPPPGGAPPPPRRPRGAAPARPRT